MFALVSEATQKCISQYTHWSQVWMIFGEMSLGKNCFCKLPCVFRRQATDPTDWGSGLTVSTLAHGMPSTETKGKPFKCAPNLWRKTFFLKSFAKTNYLFDTPIAHSSRSLTVLACMPMAWILRRNYNQERKLLHSFQSSLQGLIFKFGPLLDFDIILWDVYLLKSDPGRGLSEQSMAFKREQGITHCSIWNTQSFGFQNGWFLWTCTFKQH